MSFFGTRSTAFVLTVASIVATGEVSAQMSNRPFSFNAPGPSGVGMSVGGQQAILNRELTGRNPDALLRDDTGRLLGFVRGPGRSVIVFSPGGETLPGFRHDFRNGAAGLTAGAFNRFFVPQPGDSAPAVLISPQGTTTDLINTWTTRVVSGDGSAGFGAPNAVTVWTGYIFGLGSVRTGIVQ